nr:immunoglobulin heavy chain junction region [Macaca mulatta]
CTRGRGLDGFDYW